MWCVSQGSPETQWGVCACVGKRKITVRLTVRNCAGWQILILQGRPAGWSPREDLNLWLEAEDSLKAQFLFPKEVNLFP